MMQKTFQRFTSLLLSLTMLLSLASMAFAADTGADTSADLFGTDIEEVVSVNSPVSEEEIAKDLFQSLSEEAQQIFLAQIATDPGLTEYHRENVDPSFDPQAIPAIYAYSSELDIVRSGLANLGLSSTVTYAFTGAASAIVGGAGGAAITTSEVYALLFGTSIVTTIAAYWDEVENAFSDIVGVFTNAFSYMRSAVSNALWDTRDDAASVYYGSPVTSVSIQTFTSSTPLVRVRHANGSDDRYNCNTKAEKLYWRDGEKFFIAVLVPYDSTDMMLWVCPIPVDYATALAIRYQNNERIGILTTKEVLARELAQRAPGGTVDIVWHGTCTHKGDHNFIPHYHPLDSNGYSDRQIHLWYI